MTARTVPETHIRADAPYKALWEVLEAAPLGVWQTTAYWAEAMTRASGTHYKASRVREMLGVLEGIGAVTCRASGRCVSATRVSGVTLEFVEAVAHLTAPDCAACKCVVRYTLRLHRTAQDHGA